jgi:CBS domain-containing protein
MTVSDASQLCAAKRTDCVLVVDQEEGLSGIFTAKDLAFRVSFPFLSFFRLLFTPSATIADAYNMILLDILAVTNGHYRSPLKA